MAIDINEMNEMFVVEWNAKPKKIHIGSLGKILKRNLHAALNRRHSGYIPVAIAHTEAEALEMSKLIEAKLTVRRQRDDSSDTLH